MSGQDPERHAPFFLKPRFFLLAGSRHSFGFVACVVRRTRNPPRRGPGRRALLGQVRLPIQSTRALPRSTTQIQCDRPRSIDSIGGCARPHGGLLAQWIRPSDQHGRLVFIVVSLADHAQRSLAEIDRVAGDQERGRTNVGRAQSCE
jgi:hypothetical protein